MSFDCKGPYRVVARDEDDLNGYTVQNLVIQKLEDFPAARLKTFVVDDREDPMVLMQTTFYKLLENSFT